MLNLLCGGTCVATLAGWIATARHALALRHRLHTDPLTGLANRDALAAAVAKVSRRAGAVGLLLADLDDFKAINDQHGHAAGNLVLARVADALRRAAHPGELVVRLHGDEFAILLGALPSGAAGRRIAAGRVAAFTAAVARPLPTVHGGLSVAASIGVAVLPVEAGLSALLAAADRSMYRTKHARTRAEFGQARSGGAR